MGNGVFFMKDSYLVAQGNELVEARHNNPLSVREQKIILTMVSMIQPSDEDFKDYRISIKEFSEMLGLKGSTKYTELKEITKNLMSKSIEIPRENGGWLLANWISSAEYQTGEGVIELSFSPKLKPYLLQLKQYTSYRLSDILSLGSSYSIRLYELMRKWSYRGNWEGSVVEIREKLGAVTKSYSLYGNFKNKVLLPAIKELNEQTDFFVSFKEIKKGRSVERIEFVIQHGKKEIKSHPPEEQQKPFENEVIRERLNDLAEGYVFDQIYFAQMYQGASFIWNDNAEKELSLLIRYVNKEESVKNPLGFIKKKLQDYGKLFQDGLPVTFANLKSSKRNTGREERVPDWFNKEYSESERTEDEQKEMDEKRQKLIEELKQLKDR